MSMGRPVTPGPEGGENGKATFAMVTVLLGNYYGILRHTSVIFLKNEKQTLVFSATLFNNVT